MTEHSPGPARLSIGSDGESASLLLEMEPATGLIREETADALSVLLQYDATSEAPSWMRGRWPLWVDNSPPQVDQPANFDQGYPHNSAPHNAPPKVDHAMMGPDLDISYYLSGLGTHTRARIRSMLRLGQVDQVITFLQGIVGKFHGPFRDFFDKKDVKLIVSIEFADQRKKGPFTEFVFFEDTEEPQKTGVKHFQLNITLNDHDRVVAVKPGAEYLN